MVVTIVSNRLFGLYGRMWRHAGADEARQLMLSTAATLCVLIAFWPAGRQLRIELVPPIVVVVGCMFSAGGMGLLRFHSRLFAWQRGSKRLGLRVAVIGSRDTGAAAIREMLRTPGAGLVPVAVFDDDARAHGLSLLGIPVVGTIADIPASADRYTIQQVLLAIPSPGPEVVERALRASEIDRRVDEDPARRAGHAQRARPPGRRPPGPRTADRGPTGTHPGSHRPRIGATLAGRAPGAGDRGRWLDRIRDQPAGLEPGARAAGAPRPR